LLRCQYKYVPQEPYPQQTDKESDPGLSQSDKSTLLDHTDAESDDGIGINMKRLVRHG